LIDTNVISEARKKAKANPGVIDFFNRVTSAGEPIYLSVVTVGELRRGIELIRLRGDVDQATLLEDWLTIVLDQYADKVLAFDADAAQVWGRLRVPNPEHDLDKRIAATALVHDLTVVTRRADRPKRRGEGDARSRAGLTDQRVSVGEARYGSLSGILCLRHTMSSYRRQYAQASQEDAEGQRCRASGGVAQDPVAVA